MGEKVIVFGGSGFLGSHVADVLSDQGLQVTLFDLKQSPWAKSDQDMIVGNILDFNRVVEAIKGNEIVYHFAGLANLDDATTKPIETVSENIMGTVNLLEASVCEGVERFVFASTIYVYSGLGGFYRCSKQACELYIEEYQKRYGLDFTTLRYGSLYGPRADQRNGIRRYLYQALKDGKILFPGTGEEIREYVHVCDAAQLSVETLSEEFKNQYAIITGNHPMKSKEMLMTIQEILQQKPKIEFVSSPDNIRYTLTPYSFIPKIGKKLVGRHYIDLGQGLLECLHEISNHLDQTE